MKLAEKYKIVPVASDMDVSGSATNPCDSINMKGFHHATFIVNLQTLGGADLHCIVYSGATDAALTSALTFRYAFASAAAGSANCDVLAAASTSADLTIAHATYDNYMLIVEVDASDMDIANGEEWLTLSFPDSATGATGNLSAVAILEPRYTSDSSATALA
jgi:hypothetical protein